MGNGTPSKSLKTKKIQVDPESIRKVTTMPSKSSKTKKFKSIRKVEGRSNSLKTTTPSKSSKRITSFREDFISDKISFERRLRTLENVFIREMKSECIVFGHQLSNSGRIFSW